MHVLSSTKKILQHKQYITEFAGNLLPGINDTKNYKETYSTQLYITLTLTYS